MEMSAEALRRLGPPRRAGLGADRPGGELLVSASALQATAMVLVMLDLLAEADAEEILQAHQRGLDALGVHPRGVSTGELTLRPTSAHGFQAARRRNVESLLRRPVAVAAPAATVSVGDFELAVEWLSVAASETRGQGTISAREHGGLAEGPVEVVIACTDDAGHRYECRAWAGQRSMSIRPSPWAGAGRVTAEIDITPALPPSVTRVELHPPGGVPCPVEFHPPQAGRSGRTPQQQSPGEWLLDALLPDLAGSDPSAQYGLGLDTPGARQVTAAVADALLAVDAIPASSPLLSQYPQRQGRWPRQLARLGAARAERHFTAADRPRRVAAVGAAVPLEHGVGIFDAVVVQDRDVRFHAYVFPDTSGEYWPVAVRPFRVDAVDDLGHPHRPVPARSWSDSGHEGVGDFWLWPPLEPAVHSLRLTVDTPWETAWTEVALRND